MGKGESDRFDPVKCLRNGNNHLHSVSADVDRKSLYCSSRSVKAHNVPVHDTYVFPFFRHDFAETVTGKSHGYKEKRFRVYRWIVPPLSGTIDDVENLEERKPEWLKVSAQRGDEYREIRRNLRRRGLHTVCEEAACPNLAECWHDRTSTIMILGDTCTRACKFCDVKTGNPRGVVDQLEPERVSEMVGLMQLRYIVLTSVDRDDLPDLGAGHFGRVVDRIRADHPHTMVEALVPDFDALPEPMDTLAASRPFVVAQNLETVSRLTRTVRDPRAGYEKSLSCLDYYKSNHRMRTKTSLMVGLGETLRELEEAMDDLRSIGVDIITFGQYLRPSRKNIPVERYYTPQEFEDLKTSAYEKGFTWVASGPLVRSSYKAADYLDTVENAVKYGGD